jgi:hypothetical protein
MKKGYVVLTVVLLIAAGIGGYIIYQKLTPNCDYASCDDLKRMKREMNIIETYSPRGDNDIISSPLRIEGKTKPGWVVFEAQVGTAKLYDANGKELGWAILRAKGEWMKPEVEFEGTLVFDAPTTETGKLVFKDDNPKDEAEAKTREIIVRFDSFSNETRKMDLYYYNETKDRAIAEYLPCSPDAVLPVTREVPFSKTPVQDAVNLLLNGDLSDADKLAGFKTEFPLAGFKLAGANLIDGTLTLKFDDPENRSGGGSCRVALLTSQISKTARQFSEVKEVRFEPETLFQP